MRIAVVWAIAQAAPAIAPAAISEIAEVRAIAQVIEAAISVIAVVRAIAPAWPIVRAAPEIGVVWEIVQAVLAAAAGTVLAAEMFREAPLKGVAARLVAAGPLVVALPGKVAHEVRRAWEAAVLVAEVAAAAAVADEAAAVVAGSGRKV
jgi:hypothetical protein